MSTIKGIFEPFNKYVTDQLKLRREILVNQREIIDKNSTQEKTPIPATKLNLSIDYIKKNFTGGLLLEDVVITDDREPFNLAQRHELFYTYTTEKQCTIRMASGVNVKKENNILREGYEKNNLTGNGLARQYILEGGTQFYGKKGEFGGTREGFPEGIEDPSKGYSYGDSNIRANAQDGFGDVPMPGIIDAEVDTKSEDGSLREARISFICYNKAQLEVLELLYMRPGYPILLEWGWVPYINNSLEVEQNSFSMLTEFFDQNSNLNTINSKIREQKIKSGGNYDGFVGFCKNFAFKAREDGGYDCTTEIIAHGEILESLKAATFSVPKLQTGQDFKALNLGTEEESKYVRIENEIEVVDKLLYHLRSIKSNLDKAGYKAALTYVGTQFEKHDGIGQTIIYNLAAVPETKNGKSKEEVIRIYSEMEGCIITENKKFAICDGKYALEMNNVIPVDREDSLFREASIFYKWDEYDETGLYASGVEGVMQNLELTGNEVAFARRQYAYYEDTEGKIIPINDLNQQYLAYEEAFDDIKKLVSDVAKVPISKLDEQLQAYEQIPRKSLLGPQGGNTFYDRTKYDAAKHRETMRDLEDAGVSSIFEGTILKEFSSVNESSEDSGFRKKIFVRWDLICQIMNRLVIPEYKDGSPLTELTYLTKNSPTYSKKESKNKITRKDSKGNTIKSYYLTYAVDDTSVQFPFDDLGFNDVFLRALEKYEKQSKGNTAVVSEIADLLGDENYDLFKETYGESSEINFTNRTINFPPILGRSFDRNVCLMPHQIPQMTEAQDNVFDKNYLTHKNFTSYTNVYAQSNAIGHVYFNLDYIINQYEQLALEEFKTTDSLGEERTKRRLKKSFSLHDWITTIWNGVNDACGGYYDFGLHTEHERPNVARIIDFTMSGNSSDIPNFQDRMFTFDPQSLNSVARDSYFQSKLDNDFASVVSIAAQAPNDINSLEAVSFKAFHKGIENRFTDESKKDKRDLETIEQSLERYLDDYINYENNMKSLIVYINRQNVSNYESQLIGSGTDQYLQTPISPDTAKSLANSLIEQRYSLLTRYPEKDENGNLYDGSEAVNGKYTGQYRDDTDKIKGSTTFSRNAIIPLTTNMTLDGIAGITPLNIFKINVDKLPNGYQDPNIVFVVKKETHKITSGQDWTTDISGQLTFLNDNPGKGSNPTLKLKIRSKKEIEANDLDRQIAGQYKSFTQEVVDAIHDAAEKYNIDKVLAFTIADIESGGNPNAKNPDSSASGLFQIMPNLFKDYGVTAQNVFDPVKNADAVLSRLGDKVKELKKKVGYDPEPYEIYGIHNQGRAGFTTIITACNDFNSMPNPILQLVEAAKKLGYTRDITTKQFASINADPKIDQNHLLELTQPSSGYSFEIGDKVKTSEEFGLKIYWNMTKNKGQTPCEFIDFWKKKYKEREQKIIDNKDKLALTDVA